VRQPFERRTEAALRAPRSRRHAAHAPHAARKKADDPVSLTQRITLQDDRLGFAKWHVRVGPPTAASHAHDAYSRTLRNKFFYHSEARRANDKRKFSFLHGALIEISLWSAPVR
jgi:hypothetical protein